MRWQENMFQMKEQDKVLEEQLSEVEIGSLAGKEFRVERWFKSQKNNGDTDQKDTRNL